MHGTLDQDDLNDILKIAHMEHGLLEPDDIFEESSKQLDFSGYTSEQYEVSLKLLSDIKGVGLLAENQTISFPNEGLFIIYGDNGAGKSSYSSILKKYMFDARRLSENNGGYILKATGPSSG
ncbi:hypothetical protein OS31_34140 [Dickeya oryzae]